MDLQAYLPREVHLCDHRFVKHLFGNCRMAFGKAADTHAKDLVPLQEARLHYLQSRVVGPERLGALAADQQPADYPRLAGEAV